MVSAGTLVMRYTRTTTSDYYKLVFSQELCLQQRRVLGDRGTKHTKKPLTLDIVAWYERQVNEKEKSRKERDGERKDERRRERLAQRGIYLSSARQLLMLHNNIKHPNQEAALVVHMPSAF